MTNNDRVQAKNVPELRKKVMKLRRYKGKRLDNAICDIIEMGGYSLAVLLEKMPLLPGEKQLQVARRVEDFVYFHPEKGVRVFGRMKKALKQADEACVPHMLAAVADVADVADKIDENKGLEIADVKEVALEVLDSDADFARIGKAIEILVRESSVDSIPAIIKKMIKSSENSSKIDNYQFIEESLLALKKLGGESVLRLLINPVAPEALRQLRLRWRADQEPLLDEIMTSVKQLDAEFAHLMLKVIDLSSFNMPFSAMIAEGLAHENKWVRQAAAASMEKATEALDPDVLLKMLQDPAQEVRLMATTSLGGFKINQTGEVLEMLAAKDDETTEMRMNAIYALHAQKNRAALARISHCDNRQLSAQATGLGALLIERSSGLEVLLKAYSSSTSDVLAQIANYLLELAEPEDLAIFVERYDKSVGSESQRQRFLALLQSFAKAKAGPRLSRVLQQLPEKEREAVKLLIPDAATANKSVAGVVVN